jgi:type III restriction enzyme
MIEAGMTTTQTVIENPVINSPFAEPERHFRFSDEGITNEMVEARRESAYFIPIAAARKKGKSQLYFETEWTKDRIEPNKFINQVRSRVKQWRENRHFGVTQTTAQLLRYWTRPERERRLFFCQIEALETLIYLTEVARQQGDTWIENEIRRANEDANPKLYRLACKMATGSGKTVVMAMLIAWQTLNKLANPQDARFTDTFLIVTPGITIRDRLRVLMPNDAGNYYRQLDIVPPDDLNTELGKAKIVLTNFHAFILREHTSAGKLTKSLLTGGSDAPSPFTETPDQMVRRVCRELGTKKNILVLNDEAHHCYRRRVGGEEIKLVGQERKEAEKREEEARIWISGLEAVKAKIGVKAVYDLSATPFFLRGSGYSEGTLFPWVVSDFSLIDAIESGIVKVPRVPVADDNMLHEGPVYRDIWPLIREHLPKKGRGTDAVTGEPKLPLELEGALQSLYSNYEKYYRRWEQNAEAPERGHTPPVFIVVCNNTNVSKLVFDYIAGWEKPLDKDKSVVVPGKLPLFTNEANGAWSARPKTILVDSEQLESGQAMSDDFKQIASREIDEFKADYRLRFPGRDPDALADEDLLREVMNTVGKPGKLGEQIRCVVSVSMLTEGWDANTVTHILGVRAFGTQLLCEQVVGRGLRRMSYSTEMRRFPVNGHEAEIEAFPVEYAEVYGVPFSFIPCAGAGSDPKPGPIPTRVRALEERLDREITFPRLAGYRYDLPEARLEVKFTAESRLTLSAAELPTKTENAPIIGESVIHDLQELKNRREQEVAFLLAKLTLEKYFRQDGEHQTEKTKTHKFDSEVQSWRFPRLLEITREWLKTCVRCKDNTFPQLLLLLQFAHEAADKIYKAIVASTPGDKALKPILRPYDTLGSTRHVDFDTIKPTYTTRADRGHISHMVADTDSWEQKLAQTLEDMPEVFAYVKNQNLGFTIPYTLNGEEHNYYPDFIVRMDDGHASSPSPRDEGAGRGAPDNLLNLILECTGQKKKDKEAKVTTAQTLWIPAVNNHGEFGRWAFLEIRDPWDAKNAIRSKLKEMKQPESKVALDIRRTPGVCGGRACVGRARIPVWLLIAYLKDGLSEEALLQSYPQLTSDHIRLARDYYRQQQDEIDRDIQEEHENEETIHDGRSLRGH